MSMQRWKRGWALAVAVGMWASMPAHAEDRRRTPQTCEAGCNDDSQRCREICKKFAGNDNNACVKACSEEEKRCTRQCKEPSRR